MIEGFNWLEKPLDRSCMPYLVIKLLKPALLTRIRMFPAAKIHISPVTAFVVESCSIYDNTLYYTKEIIMSRPYHVICVCLCKILLTDAFDFSARHLEATEA